MSDNKSTAAQTIAFQGAPGAYSDMACRAVFPNMLTLACNTFTDAFSAVADGHARLAMIPIENSVAGRVADIHQLLPESSLHIVAEHYQPVRHNLLACKGATSAGLKTVRSHVHALSQCRNVIRRLGLNAVVGLLVALPIIGYVFSSFRRDAWQAWVEITPGSVNDYPKGQTRLAQFRNPKKFDVSWDGYTADIPCWVRREENGDFTVFAINCTHLGCPVRWFPESNLFMCPCHGGVYYQDGSVASGPPPRGLFEYEYQIRKDVLWVRGGEVPSLSESV